VSSTFGKTWNHNKAQTSVQGNRRLYRKLLMDFAVRYTEAIDDIQKSANWLRTLILMHS
jgi:hypothetical protein